MEHERIIERRKTPRVDVTGETATIGFRMQVRLLDVSANGVQLGVAGVVTVGTRAWLTAVLGTAPLSTPVDVCRAVPVPVDDGDIGAGVGGRLRGSRADWLVIERFVRRAN